MYVLPWAQEIGFNCAEVLHNKLYIIFGSPHLQLMVVDLQATLSLGNAIDYRDRYRT